MNDLTKTAAAGALASLSKLKTGLANVQAAIPTAGGEPILRMGRDGIWLYGAENIEVEEGSEWAVNPLSLQHGYICWKKIPEGSKEKAEKLGEVLVSMFDAKPNKAGLPDYGHPWAEQTSVTFKCVSGTDEGTQVDYKPSSVGGANFMADLIGEIMARLDTHPDSPVPVLVLSTDSYPHKTWGKTYTPEYTIVRWIGMDGVTAEADEAPAEKPAEEPKVPVTGTATRQRRAAPVDDQTRAATPEEKAAIAAAAGQQDNEAPATGEVRRRRR